MRAAILVLALALGGCAHPSKSVEPGTTLRLTIKNGRVQTYRKAAADAESQAAIRAALDEMRAALEGVILVSP